MSGTSGNPLDGKRVAAGTYRYGDVREAIEVVQYDFDYHAELLEPAARKGLHVHRLNEHGHLFYLVPAGTEPLPLPFHSAQQAMDWANAQPWGPVDWGEL